VFVVLRVREIERIGGAWNWGFGSFDFERGWVMEEKRVVTLVESWSSVRYLHGF
jgi:hypothetical protein